MNGYGVQARRTVKFEPSKIRGSKSGDSLVYTLPSGRVYDLSTLRMHVKASHQGTAPPAGPGVAVPIATIPSPCECIIETLNVSVGDVQLNQINHYSQLFAAWSRYNTPARDFGRRMMTSAASSAMQNPVDRYAAGSMIFILSTWLGLLGSGARIDLTERGSMTIDITFVDSQMLGTDFTFKTYITVDELPYGMGDPVIPYADYRTSFAPSIGQHPFGVIQTDNVEDHRLQYVCATMLQPDYNNVATVAIPDLGFTTGWRHSRLDIRSYTFAFDGNSYSHDIKYWEYLDRLREAMAGSANSLELPLLIARGGDLQLKELCDFVFLAGESALGRGIPDGTIEVTFNTKCDVPVDCYVLMFARYSCVL
jgi:hypothetical protein